MPKKTTKLFNVGPRMKKNNARRRTFPKFYLGHTPGKGFGMSKGPYRRGKR